MFCLKLLIFLQIFSVNYATNYGDIISKYHYCPAEVSFLDEEVNISLRDNKLDRIRLNYADFKVIIGIFDNVIVELKSSNKTQYYLSFENRKLRDEFLAILQIQEKKVRKRFRHQYFLIPLAFFFPFNI